MTGAMTEIGGEEIAESPVIEDDGFEFPEDNNITEMLDEVSLNTDLLSATDRYFVPYYKVDVQKPSDDICIRIHSNRICMISLAPSHPVLNENCDIEKISFKVTEKLDRAMNKISGKGKHGAQPLQETSNICIITCSNGETWTIKCCMTGKLIEVNEALLDTPNLIRELPHKGGYLAIVLPNIKVYEEMTRVLLSEEAYKKYLSDRQDNGKEKVSEDDVNIQNTTKRSLEDDCSANREEKIQKI